LVRRAWRPWAELLAAARAHAEAPPLELLQNSQLAPPAAGLSAWELLEPSALIKLQRGEQPALLEPQTSVLGSPSEPPAEVVRPSEWAALPLGPSPEAARPPLARLLLAALQLWVKEWALGLAVCR
jgi:hypothetical protein